MNTQIVCLKFWGSSKTTKSLTKHRISKLNKMNACSSVQILLKLPIYNRTAFAFAYKQQHDTTLTNILTQKYISIADRQTRQGKQSNIKTKMTTTIKVKL